MRFFLSQTTMSKEFGYQKAEEMSDIEKMRHSLAHIFAGVVMEMYPNTKLAIGPSVADGFYYDVESDHTFTPDDFKEIEKKMRKVVNQDLPFEGREVSTDEAIAYFEEQNQPYKVEIIKELGDKKITFYSHGEFTDLCKGGHTESTGQVGAFKLDRVAGAYWRGDETNQMLQRIYGLAFATKEELNDYLQMREEARKRDHRKIGKELDLMAFSELVGPGLPLFTPRGTVIYDEIANYSKDLRAPYKYQRVSIPHITKKALYETSGHWDKYQDDLFHVKGKSEGDEFVMKPMNCPHHQQIYAAKPRSYRDLPLRYMETTRVYRDELPGEILGLSRVRAITQDDAHVFCAEDQVAAEMTSIISMCQEFLKTFDLEYEVWLSVRDPENIDKYLGDNDTWDRAEAILEQVAKDNNLPYKRAEGEAAIYGPKLDFMAKDAIGREWQLCTPQLDLVQPVRFGLKYTGEDGNEHTPIMIHCAIAGSLERFMSVMIEHFAGAFPAWLSPEHLRLLAVSERHNEFVEQLAAELEGHGLRVGVDISDNTVGKKIREAEKMKTPYILVIGDKEKDGEDLMVRKRGSQDTESYSKEKFIAYLTEKIQSRSLEL